VNRTSKNPRRRQASQPDQVREAKRPATLTVARGDEKFEFRDRLPLLPLRDVVVFPYMTIPLLVGRLPSINAIEKAVAGDRMLFVTAQKRSEIADPSHQELYRVGTVVRARWEGGESSAVVLELPFPVDVS